MKREYRKNEAPREIKVSSFEYLMNILENGSQKCSIRFRIKKSHYPMEQIKIFRSMQSQNLSRIVFCCWSSDTECLSRMPNRFSSRPKNFWLPGHRGFRPSWVEWWYQLSFWIWDITLSFKYICLHKSKIYQEIHFLLWTYILNFPLSK
jgi:hypothetical protein